jgi:hypothetical protein
LLPYLISCHWVNDTSEDKPVEESEGGGGSLTDSMEPAGRSYHIVLQLLEAVFLNNNFGTRISGGFLDRVLIEDGAFGGSFEEVAGERRECVTPAASFIAYKKDRGGRGRR